MPTSVGGHLVWLYHLDHSVPSDLAVTTASLWALGIALCYLVAQSWRPTSGFGSWDRISFLPTFVLSHGELVERVRIPFFSPLLFSIPVDPVRCGLSLSRVWCLLFFWFHSFDPCRFLWRVDQRKVNPMCPSFGSFVLKPLYART
jgi:hypothetical protein